MSAADRGWGPGFPHCQWGKFITLVRKDGLRLPVRQELADLTTMLLDLTELSDYDLIPGHCWGVACRAISGTNTPSNHSWGLADDLNAPSNPYASATWHRRNARGTRPFGLAIVCNIPENVVTLWESHGYRWGGRYQNNPDPMHMEFMGTPADARTHTLRLRSYLAELGQPAPPPPTRSKQKPTSPTKEQIMALPTLEQGDEGQYVRNLQGGLVAHGNVRGIDGQPFQADGDFGPVTFTTLKDWQRRTRKLKDDGICGPKTWSWLTGVS